MTESYHTHLWDATEFDEELTRKLPENEIVAMGEFIEPLEYRSIRTPNGDHLICVDATVGYDSTLFDDVQEAMRVANYQLYRMMSFDRSVVSDEAIQFLDSDESETD